MSKLHNTILAERKYHRLNQMQKMKTRKQIIQDHTNQINKKRNHCLDSLTMQLRIQDQQLPFQDKQHMRMPVMSKRLQLQKLKKPVLLRSLIQLVLEKHSHPIRIMHKRAMPTLVKLLQIWGLKWQTTAATQKNMLQRVYQVYKNHIKMENYSPRQLRRQLKYHQCQVVLEPHYLAKYRP